jgi:glycosyltransferase involved in cell wall biosynthesis
MLRPQRSRPATGVAGDHPVRVLFLVPNLFFGGAERHLVSLVTSMDTDAFAPAVACINAGGHLFPEVLAGGVPVERLGRRAGEPVRTIVDLVALLRRLRPDVLVMRGHSAEVMGRVAASIARVPSTVVWVHNCSDIRPRHPARKVLDRVLSPLTTAVFGVAHAQVPYLTQDLGYRREQVRIVHNGVVAPQPAPSPERDQEVADEFGLAPDEPVIGIVAMLRAEKDHATLLRALSRVHEEFPRAKLLLVGEGPLRNELERLAVELGIADRVVFAGGRDDVARVLRAMDVVTLCSTTECFPMAVLEAMAATRPVVCTEVGGIPEAVAEGETGHLVPPGDPVALADALRSLLRDPARARAMGAAGRARLDEAFSLERSVHTAEEVLAEVVGRGPTPAGTTVGSAPGAS